MSAKRFGYELLIILLLILVAAGIWVWKDREARKALDDAELERDQAVAALAESGEDWAGALAASEATATFRAFASGVQPLILNGRTEVLDQAVGSLLELPEVTFVHVLGADGDVLASSDRKLTTTGTLPEADRWVLETSDVMDREGEGPGTRELAAPVVGAAGPAAYLWMGYDVGSLLDQTRPADWPGATEAASDAPGTQPRYEAEEDGGQGAPDTEAGDDGAGGAGAQ